MKSLSRVWLFVTPWTVAYQAPPSMGFSRQEYWSGLPLPSPGDLPDPGIEPGSPSLQADALPYELPGKPGNEWSNAICSNMDGLRNYYTKWSKSYGKRQISWYHLPVEPKKKWYRWTYLQNRNRLTDTENQLIVTVVTKEGKGIN